MQLFLRISQPKFYNKNGHFGFFKIIKNYAETNLLNDEKFLSKEVSYTAQQKSFRVKVSVIVENLFSSKDFGFYIVNNTFLDYQAKIFSLIPVFGDLTFVDLCWAV